MKFAPLPVGPTPAGFRTVVADCPWPYKDRLPGGGRGAAKHYDLLTIEDLKILGAGLKCEVALDAHLYLWCTNSFIEQAHQVARAWGFEPKTLLTWVKAREGTGKLQMGMGHYYRGATEHVLFAVRGRLPTQRNDILNVFFAPREKHSAKPQTFYDMVELMSLGPYLELFARQPRLGWATWGNELEDDETATS